MQSSRAPAAWAPLNALCLSLQGVAMSRSQQRQHQEQKESQDQDVKLPEIPCPPEYKAIPSQPPKEHKLPSLTPDHRQLSVVSGKSFGSRLFENSWKHAVLKTTRIKKEYTSAYGLRDSNEAVPMPRIFRESQKSPAVPNPSPVSQIIQGVAIQFPASTFIKHELSSLPPLPLVPSASSQNFLEGLFKSKGDTVIEDIEEGMMCSWKPDNLKTAGIHGGAGELGVMRSAGIHGGAGELGVMRWKKYNRCSSRFRFKPGYRFIDPVSGAPPQYLHRLSEMAALECETIHHERSKKIRRSKKQES